MFSLIPAIRGASSGRWDCSGSGRGSSGAGERLGGEARRGIWELGRVVVKNRAFIEREPMELDDLFSREGEAVAKRLRHEAGAPVARRHSI